ncbi:hypothetical protein Poli38472_011470 [Pythium oligandrum]|uniref:Uncharacterized protein n=1 Tax=Pythium oligandrum TaxID=41045 RepID=A0A8K1FI44_PYTOL|nr:hypothetical protein Poli38472_011470 [Pythium oligandrum]|eukprot:TMW64590.1 hypothetical protein Poli38472_011470 [Pythium oligandrum]
MEVWLLSTTEKEGEDNALYHRASSSHPTRWSELRGVLAAAMGTMSTFAGEPLVSAHFSIEDRENAIVGYVNLYEVLFVMVFDGKEALPARIVEYYTRSTCELLVSVMGYPDHNLGRWEQRTKGNFQLRRQLDSFFVGVFQCIERDLQWGTHLQGAFDGSVPAVMYHLEDLARLSAFQVIEPHFEKNSVVGFSLFYRQKLVIAKMRPDILKLVSQWLLQNEFDDKAHTSGQTGCSHVHLFTWHDAFYACHGVYPDNHSLIRINQGEVQYFYLIHHDDIEAFLPYRDNPARLLSIEDIDELASFADTHLRRHYDGYMTKLQALPSLQSSSLFCCVVVDKLRHAMYSSQLTTSHDQDPDQSRRWLKLFTDRVCSFQRTLFDTEVMDIAGEDKDRQQQRAKRWLPRVKLDTSDPDALLFRPLRPEDTEADLSAEDDAQIFPPVYHQLEREEAFRQREIHQEAERHMLSDGTSVWVVAEYYEAFNMFAICDSSVPLTLFEKEMDRLLLASS